MATYISRTDYSTGVPESRPPVKPVIKDDTIRESNTPSRDTGHLYVGPHTKGHYISSAHFALISQEASMADQSLS